MPRCYVLIKSVAPLQSLAPGHMAVASVAFLAALFVSPCFFQQLYLSYIWLIGSYPMLCYIDI